MVGPAPEETGPQLPHCLLSCQLATLRDKGHDRSVKEGWFRLAVKTAGGESNRGTSKEGGKKFLPGKTHTDEMRGEICFVTKKQNSSKVRGGDPFSPCLLVKPNPCHVLKGHPVVTYANSCIQFTRSDLFHRNSLNYGK